jgi:glycosyltransferase involved in cell wall biosynthesis
LTAAPELSVIVPAYRATHLLPDTLAALAASEFPRERWELIVVDDASGDATADVAARWADRVIVLPGVPSGPGGARNAGARSAGGGWLVFIDADVRVHPDALRRIADIAQSRPDLVAIFGSYDAHPAQSGVLSEYRNLLHRQVHCAGAGDAETFWAGCGAVRRDAFDAAGGFDVVRFARPSIEDIELGYRLRDRGGRILLDPAIQGTHLKRWTLGAMVRTDIRDRGIPWMRLLLERGNRRAAALNTTRGEQLKVILAATATLFLFAALPFRDPRLAILAAALLGVLIASNFRTYAWFARQRSWGFALAVIPLNLLYYLGNAVAAGAGMWQHLTSARPTSRQPLPEHRADA